MNNLWHSASDEHRPERAILLAVDQELGEGGSTIGAGELGSLRGQGTASMSAATLTSDEQAQLCTTGDLTWTVEFVQEALTSPLGLSQHPARGIARTDTD